MKEGTKRGEVVIGGMVQAAMRRKVEECLSEHGYIAFLW